MENLHTNDEDKKSQGLKPTNLNLLYKIKLYKFTWPLYPKVYVEQDSLSKEKKIKSTS